MRIRDINIEKNILQHFKSSRYLDKLSVDEKEYLDNIFYFVDSYRHKVRSLVSNTFSETYCITCGLKNIIPYDYSRKIPKKYCSNICNFKSNNRSLISQEARAPRLTNSRTLKKRYIDNLNDDSVIFLDRNMEVELSIISKKNITSQYHTILSNEELSYMNSFWSYAKTIKERVFLLENNIFTRMKCNNCSKELDSPLFSSVKGVRLLKKFCSVKCKNESKEIREKISNSVSGSYKNNLELSSIKTNSGRRWRCFSMPSGRLVYVQGYESFAIIELLQKHHEDDISIHRDVPIIRYKYKGIDRNHFADFYIKSTNTLIDVKSKFTYEVEIEKNNAKKITAESQGFNYNFMIISRRKNENKNKTN